MMYLTFLAAFMLSTIAAYYSIVGLTTIFMGAFWPILIMGVGLELAKLVTTSWLYQNWKKASWLLKTYLTIAVIMLMLITSMGIFGFLAKSHIDSTQGNKSNATDIATLTTQEGIAKARLDYLLARAKDPSSASPYLDRQIQDTQKELTRISKAKAPLLQEENKLIADVGPLVYIAEIFYDDSVGSVDKAVRLVIMMIMVVFDPLAILLLIAANSLLREKQEKKRPKEDANAASTKEQQPNAVKANEAKAPPPSQVENIQKVDPPTASTSPPVTNEAPASVVNAVATPQPAAVAATTSPTPAPARAAATPTAPAPAPATTVAAPAPRAPVDPVENERQLSTLLMTNNDIVAAYKLFLGRAPTPQDDLGRFKGMTSRQLLDFFYSSPEFLARSGADTLVQRAAIKVEELSKARNVH